MGPGLAYANNHNQRVAMEEEDDEEGDYENDVTPAPAASSSAASSAAAAAPARVKFIDDRVVALAMRPFPRTIANDIGDALEGGANASEIHALLQRVDATCTAYVRVEIVIRAIDYTFRDRDALQLPGAAAARLRQIKPILDGIEGAETWRQVLRLSAAYLSEDRVSVIGVLHQELMMRFFEAGGDRASASLDSVFLFGIPDLFQRIALRSGASISSPVTAIVNPHAIRTSAPIRAAWDTIVARPTRNASRLAGVIMAKSLKKTATDPNKPRLLDVHNMARKIESFLPYGRQHVDGAAELLRPPPRRPREVIDLDDDEIIPNEETREARDEREAREAKRQKMQARMRRWGRGLE